MNVKTVKYKAIAFSLITALLFSGCKDFMERDVEDGYSVESVKTLKQYQDLTGALYGAQIWIGYHTKFNWVVNEGLAGNLINIYDDEGALFLGKVGATNTHFNDGYRSLFSGVISAANYLINKPMPTLSDEEAEQVKAEAKMFRGLAYFMATEYWGEVPLVRDNEKVIANKLTVPKADRATIYRAIEMDWLDAARWLPEDPNWRAGRATKWSAQGMLAKLYLTMASCVSDEVATYGCPFNVNTQGWGGGSDYYYDQAKIYADSVINSGYYSLVPYADIFALKSQMHNPCNEALFSLHFSDVNGYGTGAHWQAHMSASYGPDDVEPAEKLFWGPGTCWGGWKSLAWTLYESYEDGDLRKREVIICAGEKNYTNWQGTPAPFAFEDYGMSGGLGLNKIKKYVYGWQSTTDAMSNPMRLDFLRLADVYMIYAEAEMYKGKGVTDKVALSQRLVDVVRAHGGPDAVAKLPTTMAFCNVVPLERELEYIYKGWSEVLEKDLQEEGLPFVRTTMMVPMKRTGQYADFIQERRKEFAMEGHGWVDVKRLFYRDPKRAQEFFKEQDRGWCTQDRYGEDIAHGVDSKNPGTGYVRRALYQKAVRANPDIWLPINDAETEPPTPIEPSLSPREEHKGVYYTTWFLPIPADVALQIPTGSGQNYIEELENGTYKW